MKVFEEERELTVMMLVDASASARFGTRGRTKEGLAAELAGVLSYSAVINGDAAGLMLFARAPMRHVPPKSGKRQVLRVLREIVDAASTGAPVGGTDVAAALRMLTATVRRRAVVFVLSDFRAPVFTRELRVAARRHDVIGLHLWDAADRQLPPLGLLPVVDLETGAQQWVDASDVAVQKSYTAAFDAHFTTTRQTFREAGASFLSLRTDEDYVPVLQRFFHHR